MYLMYYLNEKGERVYTLKVIICDKLYIHNFIYVQLFLYKIKIICTRCIVQAITFSIFFVIEYSKLFLI